MFLTWPATRYIDTRVVVSLYYLTVCGAALHVHPHGNSQTVVYVPCFVEVDRWPRFCMKPSETLWCYIKVVPVSIYHWCKFLRNKELRGTHCLLKSDSTWPVSLREENNRTVSHAYFRERSGCFELYTNNIIAAHAYFSEKAKWNKPITYLQRRPTHFSRSTLMRYLQWLLQIVFLNAFFPKTEVKDVMISTFSLKSQSGDQSRHYSVWFRR